ncbi:hypothetical protein [Demequina flava]|uniref:hypothetical protein n=1 Tax=Demequina flava TaxID=1095025 RepID=UPI0007835622|nr:hypothetical protein [Demequina flava]
MITTAPRRRAGQRISSALWGVLVIGAGVLMVVSFSGHEVDLELLAIILLAALGGWMLLSAALSGLGRKREIRSATAPVEEETYSEVDGAQTAAGAEFRNETTESPVATEDPVEDEDSSDQPDDDSEPPRS